jgi:hypothetical protein
MRERTSLPLTERPATTNPVAGHPMGAPSRGGRCVLVCAAAAAAHPLSAAATEPALVPDLVLVLPSLDLPGR